LQALSVIVDNGLWIWKFGTGIPSLHL